MPKNPNSELETVISARKLAEDETRSYDDLKTAVFMVRDLNVTKELGLTDLFWIMHRENIHRNDVLPYLKQMQKHLEQGFCTGRIQAKEK